MLDKNLPLLITLVKETGSELIVVDNHSQDGTKDTLFNILCEQKNDDNIRIILNDTNLGVSEGRNAGWRAASREFILSIDDDIEFSTQDIVDMMAAALSGPHVGLVSPDIIDSLSGRTLNQHCQELNGSASFFYEACFLIPHKVLEHVGYLDSNLLVAGEGLDFSFRLRKAGYHIKRLSSTRVLHIDRIRTGSTSMDRRRQWLWSFCYVYWKNLGTLMAIGHSLRILLAHIKVGLKQLNLSFIISLPSYALSGAYAGRAMKSYSLSREPEVGARGDYGSVDKT